jgi:outer membrane lipoprotein SlyB
MEAIMTKTKKKVSEASSAPRTSHTHGGEVGAIAGEVAGGVLGSAAGPAGAIAGMVMGAAAGALVGEVLDRENVRAHGHDEELDAEIGVSRGDLGSVRPPKGK